MRILAFCGNGLGSSLLIEMNLKEVLSSMGIEAEVSHTDVMSAKTESADIYVASHELFKDFPTEGKKIVALVNLIDKEELKAKLREVL